MAFSEAPPRGSQTLCTVLRVFSFQRLEPVQRAGPGQGSEHGLTGLSALGSLLTYRSRSSGGWRIKRIIAGGEDICERGEGTVSSHLHFRGLQWWRCLGSKILSARLNPPLLRGCPWPGGRALGRMILHACQFGKPSSNGAWERHEPSRCAESQSRGHAPEASSIIHALIPPLTQTNLP